MSPEIARRPRKILIAACLITLIFGSLHSFSVFIASLERELGASRAQVSAIYSFALLFLTLAVYSGHRVFGLLTPARFVLLLGGIACGGLLLAAFLSSLLGMWFGYSALFGTANGFAYGYSLQIAAQAMPDRKGLAMGLVTALYAVGAIVFTQIFALWVANHGGMKTFALLAILLVPIVGYAAFLLKSANAQFHRPRVTGTEALSTRWSLLVLLWLTYGLGVAAGLMVMGHAASIVIEVGGHAQQVVLGVMLIGVGNALGGIVVSYLADRCSVSYLLIGLPLLSAIMLLVMANSSQVGVTLWSLSAIGFAYGALIAIYPATVAQYFGLLRGVRVYGQVFTAWGLAGLTAPWFAGYLFDLTKNYQLALYCAAGCAFLSAGLVVLLPNVDRS